jgi:hypothetical protein
MQWFLKLAFVEMSLQISCVIVSTVTVRYVIKAMLKQHRAKGWITKKSEALPVNTAFYSSWQAPSA